MPRGLEEEPRQAADHEASADGHADPPRSLECDVGLRAMRGAEAGLSGLKIGKCSVRTAEAKSTLPAKSMMGGPTL